MNNLIARIRAAFARKPKSVMGSRPGYLWEPARRRWVPEDEATCMVFGAYTPIGPVYVPTGLHP